jgi:hypothetical protein
MIANLALMMATVATPPNADELAKLVSQLGDAKFAVREAAQRQLLKYGEAIVPELDKLAKTADAETADRLRKIRYELTGYKDDILRLVEGIPFGKDTAPPPIDPELRGLIAKHQPGSGDLLLAVLTNPRHTLNRRALSAFVSAWDEATPDQVETYLQHAVYLRTNHRSKFPAKVGAIIWYEAQLRHGWSGWPNGSKFQFQSWTTRYLDGKRYELPFKYPFPFAAIGSFRIGELAEGGHKIQAILEYEFTQKGVTRKGEIRSAESKFEVISASTADDLICPPSEANSKLVRSKFTIRENDHDPKNFTGFQVGRLPAQGAEYHWHPQVTWSDKPGTTAGVHCPIRLLNEPLDIDLCFEAEIHDVKSGKVYPAGSVVVPAGQTSRDYIYPRDVREFAKDRDGFVTVKMILKPSRAMALTYPSIRSYFPETITSGELRMKVFQKVEPIP